MVRTIGDLMCRDVITLKKDSKVMDAVRIMADRTISCIVIVDNAGRKPLGIITERDMVKRVLGNRVDPKEARISDFMTSPVMTIASDKRITDAINMMQKYHFRRVVVTDKGGRLAGILTQSDLLNEVYRIQLELESMNKNLMNAVKSIDVYKKVSGKPPKGKR